MLCIILVLLDILSSGQSVIDICGGQSPVLNIGDQGHLVLLKTAPPSGACVCRIHGSTEVVLRDFITITNLPNAPNDKSDSTLWLGPVLYDSRYNSSIVHGDLAYVNVSSLTFSFKNLIQRLWLRVTVKDNGTYIRCEDLTTNMATNSTSAGITTNAMNSSPTHTETTANVINPEMNTVTVPQDLRRTPYPLMSPLTSSVPDPSKSRNTTTLGTPNSSTSVIVFVASGSVVIVVLMIVFGGILIVKHKRRQNLKRPRNVLKNKPQSERRPTLSIDPLNFENFAMEGIVNNEYYCQTVAHVPRITRGSVEYAMSMPPKIYHYACNPYDEPDSESMSSQTYINSSDNKHADDEDGMCNPYFPFRPLSEEVIRTDFGKCINDTKRAIHGAHDAANGTNERDPVSTVHIYNHIMLGREVTEVNRYGSVLSSDDYSHISANDVVNIQADRSRGQPSDDNCHIGSIDVNGRKHLSGGDYDHLVM